MNIVRIERTAVRVPFFPGVLPSAEFEKDYNKIRPEPLDRRRQEVVRIHTDEGLSGIGMGDAYFGDPPGRPAGESLLGRNPLEFDPRALRAVETGCRIALFDLIGKALGWPLYRIFGGKCRDRIPVNYWITRMGPEASAAAAKRASSLGFTSIKIKSVWEDRNVVDRVLAISDAVPGMRVVVDAKCRFHTVEQALDLARRIESCDVVFEDPIPQENLEGYRRLKESTAVFIALHLQTPAQVLEAAARNAVDGLNIGPSGWAFMDQARIADAAGLPVWQGSNIELGLSDVFRLHASAAVPNCTLGSDLSGNFVHEHSLLSASLVNDGCLILPEKPGLGVDLDEEAVSRYAVSEPVCIEKGAASCASTTYTT